MGDTTVCFHCGGIGVPYRAKLICETCGQIIETCCEGAPMRTEREGSPPPKPLGAETVHGVEPK